MLCAIQVLTTPIDHVDYYLTLSTLSRLSRTSRRSRTSPLLYCRIYDALRYLQVNKGSNHIVSKGSRYVYI